MRAWIKKLRRMILGEYGVFWSTDAAYWEQRATLNRFNFWQGMAEIESYYVQDRPYFCRVDDMRTGENILFKLRGVTTFPKLPKLDLETHCGGKTT